MKFRICRQCIDSRTVSIEGSMMLEIPHIVVLVVFSTVLHLNHDVDVIVMCVMFMEDCRKNRENTVWQSACDCVTVSRWWVKQMMALVSTVPPPPAAVAVAVSLSVHSSLSVMLTPLPHHFSSVHSISSTQKLVMFEQRHYSLHYCVA